MLHKSKILMIRIFSDKMFVISGTIYTICAQYRQNAAHEPLQIYRTFVIPHVKIIQYEHFWFACVCFVSILD